MNKDYDVELVESHLSQLSEFFDTVQIFATRHEAEGTINVQMGQGNFYARYGHVRLWLKNEECNNENFSMEKLEEMEEE